MKNLLSKAHFAIYILLLLVFSCGNPSEKTTEVPEMIPTKMYVDYVINVDSIRLRSEYERGFKDALERLALLHLELDMKNERRAYGEMFDILYERGGIKH